MNPWLNRIVIADEHYMRVNADSRSVRAGSKYVPLPDLKPTRPGLELLAWKLACLPDPVGKKCLVDRIRFADVEVANLFLLR